MRPIPFKEMNVTWAENQPEYLPLPAYTDDRETITRWQLNFRERVLVFLQGIIWVRQVNLKHPLQAQLLTVDTPFITKETT